MPGDGRLVLAVAGPADLVAGRLEDLDHPVVEVPLRGQGDPDRVDGVGHEVRPRSSTEARSSADQTHPRATRLGRLSRRVEPEHQGVVCLRVADDQDPVRAEGPGPVGDRLALPVRPRGSPGALRPESRRRPRPPPSIARAEAGTTRKPVRRLGLWPVPLGREDGVEPLQAEGEADPSVVAVAAEDPGQAVVSAAAADLDRASGRRGDDLEDHLRVEADPPAEAEVELEPVGRDAVVARARGPGLGARRRSRARAPRSRGPGGRGPRPAGPFRSARARTWSRTRSRASSQAWPRSHFRRSRWMISWPARRPLTTGTSVRNRRSIPPSSAAVDRQGELLAARSLAEPLGEVVEPPAERADVAPLGGGLAEHLHQGRLRRRRAGRIGRASPGSGRRGRAGASPPRRPRLGRAPRRPAQITSASAKAPESPSRSTPTWWNSRSRSARLGLSLAEGGAGVADPPGERRAAARRRCRPGRSRPSTRGGGRPGRPWPASSNSFETIPAPLFRSWSSTGSSTGVLSRS